MTWWRQHPLFASGTLRPALQGVTEGIGGLLLTLLSGPALIHFAGRLTQGELAEDPHDALASHLMLWVSHVSTGSKLLFGLFLLGHGLTKLMLVVALLRGQNGADAPSVAARGLLY